MSRLTPIVAATMFASCAVDVPGTDLSGDSASDAIRRAPVVVSVGVSPSAPSRGDRVVCAAVATDPDGDAPLLSYTWSTGAAGAEITVTDSEPRHTVLTCTVVARDAVDPSLFDSGLASTEVGNTAPEVRSVVLLPSGARTTDTLTAEVDAVDVDGDALSLSYAWTVDGDAVPGVSGASLPSSAFVKGQQVGLEVWVSDGEATTKTAAVPIEIANTPPSAPGLALTPVDAVDLDPLLCSVVAPATDPDVRDGVDALTYSFAWTVDGAAFTGAVDAPLSSEVLAESVVGDASWTCSAFAGDGDAVGPAASDTVWVEASPAPGEASSSMLLGTLRYIPAGSFTMGCLTGRDDVEGVTCAPPDPAYVERELPSREVTLTTPLWMMESELTQGMWTALGLTNPSWYSGSTRPVETVTWWEALEAANAASAAEGLASCYALTGCTEAVGSGRTCAGVTVTAQAGHPKHCEGWRLPTEAEWEYAARAGTHLPFSGSSDVHEVAWYSGNNSPVGTKPVCTRSTPRNAWGLCDMSGNVTEWVWEWLSPDYTQAVSLDPAGPTSGERRVARGGAWASVASNMRVAIRGNPMPNSRGNGRGFRLVRSVR